ncbi:hypothetical protein TNCT_344361, partial [Trichonephila clavata]
MKESRNRRIKTTVDLQNQTNIKK